MGWGSKLGIRGRGVVTVVVDIQLNGVAEQGERCRSRDFLNQTHQASPSAIVDDDRQDQSGGQEDGDRRVVGGVLEGL